MLAMDRWLRRAEPASIDITWVSCRGVRSSLPFHTPCLYASIYLQAAPSSASSKGSSSYAARRPHRVKTPTDRVGGENPEWDAPLRLYVPDAASPEPEKEAKKDADGGVAGLLVRFELKSEVAVLGDVLSASAAVPVSDLVADGRTRRVSYQLAASDGRQRNGIISFSYAFHHRANVDDGVEDDRSSDGEPVTPPCSATSRAITLPPPPPPRLTTASSGAMYPVIDWPLTEQVPVLYPPPVTADTVTATGSRYYPPPPPSNPVAVYPPPSADTLGCGVYPAVGETEPSGMYPMVDLALVNCYPPTAPLYGGGCGYAEAPEWDGRCLPS